MEKEDIVKYWIESSDSDFQVMESLFENEHYVWALFLGHLVVEKLLKAYHVKMLTPIIPESIISWKLPTKRHSNYPMSESWLCRS